MYKAMCSAGFLVFFLIGSGLILSWLYDFHRISDADGWDSVVGNVVSSRVVSSSVSSSSGGNSSSVYRPVVKYKYFYKGRNYEGSNSDLSTVKTATSYEKAKGISDSFSSSSEVTLFVDPKNPRKSVLQRTIDNREKMPLFAGFAFLLFSIFILAHIKSST